MKRKRGGNAATDLRSFLQRAAAKKKPTEPEVVTPCTNENQMRIVVFQGHSTSGTCPIPSEAVRDELQQPTILNYEQFVLSVLNYALLICMLGPPLSILVQKVHGFIHINYH